MENHGNHRWLDLTFRDTLLLSMCGLVLLTGAIILFVADRGNRTGTQALADALFREVSSHTVTQTEDFVQRATPVAASLEELADQGLMLDDLDKLAPQLLAFLNGNPGMTWVLYGDESGEYTGATRLQDGSVHIERTQMTDGKTLLTEYAVQEDGSWVVVRRDDDYGYDPRERPFYQLAKETGGLAWTPPYMFFTQGVPGISCVIPVRHDDGSMRGVFSVEFDLRALSQFVSELSVSANSRVFLFMPDLTLLAHPNQRDAAGTGVAGQGEMLTLADTGDPLVDVFRRYLQPEHIKNAEQDEAFHFFDFRHDGVGYMASTTVFPISDGQSWVVGAIAPESDFLAGVWHTRWLSLIAATVALIIAALLAAAIARRISRPVQSLIAFMQKVGDGDLDARADFQGGREFRTLASELNQMIADLRERLHLRNALKVAMDVQQSLLPAANPVSPRLDVAGRSEYCDETGGDYYDFIDVTALSPTSMMVAVGDVMGHGIPAALLMATARAALRTSAMSEHNLAELITRTNRVLATDNRHNRFMTLCLMMIDAETYTVRWVSAGHDPAIVFDPATSSFRELEGGGLPLGVTEAAEYEQYTSGPMPTGGVLVVGTDGVWEMFNEQKQQYGKQRLQAAIREHHQGTAAQISAALEADLAAFRGKESPADDVTFVVVKFAATGVDTAAAAGQAQGPQALCT